MKANRLEDVIRFFNSRKPLTPTRKEEWNEFYTDTRRQEIAGITAELTNSPLGYKLLFGGYTGNGKSTELNKLVHSKPIQDHFSVIHFDIRDLLDPMDIDIFDLLLTICLLMLDFTDRNGIVIESRLVKEFENLEMFFRDTLQIDSHNKDAPSGRSSLGIEGIFSPDSEYPLIRIAAMLFSRMKSRRELRETVRETCFDRVGNLTDLINDLMLSIYTASGEHPFLLVVNGLDRVPMDKAKKLFIEDGQTISMIRQASCVFTVPVSIIHSPAASIVEEIIGPVTTLRNLRMKTPKGLEDLTAENNRQILEYFFCNRVEYDLITESALKMATDYSGGVFGIMMKLVASAAAGALARGNKRMNESDMKEAVSQARTRMLRPLSRMHWEMLLEIHENKMFLSELDEERLQLLNRLYVLEYINGDVWYTVNPLLTRSVEKYRDTKRLRRPQTMATP